MSVFAPCSSSEGRPFRLGTGANMEKVVKMDRDMTKVSSGLVAVHTFGEHKSVMLNV